VCGLFRAMRRSCPLRTPLLRRRHLSRCFTICHGQRCRIKCSQIHRVLRPGGAFAGTDGLNSRMMRLMHLSDTFTPIDPIALPARLEEAGFRDTSLI